MISAALSVVDDSPPNRKHADGSQRRLEVTAAVHVVASECHSDVLVRWGCVPSRLSRGGGNMRFAFFRIFRIFFRIFWAGPLV